MYASMMAYQGKSQSKMDDLGVSPVMETPSWIPLENKMLHVMDYQWILWIYIFHLDVTYNMM